MHMAASNKIYIHRLAEQRSKCTPHVEGIKEESLLFKPSYTLKGTYLEDADE